MVKVTVDTSCLSGLGGGATYDDTDVLNRIKALEGRTDNFVKEATVSRKGNKVKFTYTRVDGTSSEVEFDDKDTISIAYDDTALKERVTALEEKEDKDTVYDDTELKGRVQALYEKVDNDTVYDDTEVKNRLTTLEEKVDNDTIYDDSALKARVEALEARSSGGTNYDDSEIREEIQDLGTSVASMLHEVGTIKTNIESRIEALEAKVDKGSDCDCNAINSELDRLELRLQNLERILDAPPVPFPG